jgi:hypothetical protein
VDIMLMIWAKIEAWVAPYLLPVVAIACLACGAAALWYRADAAAAAAKVATVTAARDRALADLSTAVGVNKGLAASIERMRAQAERNDALVADLAASVSTINETLSQQNEAVAGLRDKDATVRSYLDTPVPCPLGRLYNGKAEPDCGAAPDHQGKGAGGAPSTLP